MVAEPPLAHSLERPLKLMAIGTAAGLFSGLFGVGGGIVIVPLLVLSLPSVDALLQDIAYLGTVSGREGLEKLVEDQIKGKAGGLKGLDRAKPIGRVRLTAEL